MICEVEVEAKLVRQAKRSDGKHQGSDAGNPSRPMTFGFAF